jgi:hypothetical protein
MDQLLAKIKALFAPTRAEPPPPQVEVSAPPATAPEVVQVAEARAPEPVARVEEPLPVEEPPVFAQAAPILAREAPTLTEEPPTFTEETPMAVEEAPTDLEPVSTDGLTLRLATERGSPSTFQVTKSGATIGRGPESTIQLADLSVSRKHARIAYKQGAYWLSDLGSMGGTWVDGTKLAAPRRVATGQTIDIGLCRLVVVAAAEGEKTGAAKGPSNAA